jgi:hypothetical protein
MKSIAKKFEAHSDMAYREHDKMTRGIPINPVAVHNAMMQVQTGMNPETGMAFQDEMEVQAFIEAAALTPPEHENSMAHMETHDQFMVSVEFEQLPEDVQRRFMLHRQLTQQKLAQEQPAAEGVKTSLQLRGTIGPTGAASILSKQGNPEITPEVMAEPPLETVVLDTIDKADADAAGNDPLEGAERGMAALQAEELHQANMREAHAKADLAEKKAKQSDFTPKTSTNE